MSKLLSYDLAYVRGEKCLMKWSMPAPIPDREPVQFGETQALTDDAATHLHSMILMTGRPDKW